MNKYRVAAKPDRTDADGIVFHSKAERLYHEQLKLDPDIAWVLRQVPVQLGPDYKTVVDFLVSYYAYRVEAHEYKGYVKPADRKTWKLWKKYAKFPLRIVKQKGKRFETVKVIEP